MNARRQIIAALSEDSLGGIATLADVDHAEQLVNAHRAEVLNEGATELDQIANQTEARVAEHYGAASGIGPGSAEMVREAARTLRSLAGATVTPELTIYRAEYDSFVFGLYTTAAAAREHCETHERRDQPTAELDWIEDEEDGVAELVATVGGDERPTGYVVTALEVASAYDPDGDE